MKKLLIAIILILLFLGLGLGGFLFWYYLPINRIERAFVEEDYEQVTELYSKLNKDDDKAYVRNELAKIAEDYYEDYLEENIEYEEVNEYLKLISKEVMWDNERVITCKSNLKIVCTSRKNYNEGQRYMDNGDYISAIDEFRKTTDIDVKYYKKAGEKIEECTDAYCQAVLDDVDKLVNSKDYENARDLIVGALNYFPDREDLSEKLSEIEAYLNISIVGTWVSQYNFGTLIANELGVSDYDIDFTIDIVCEISESNMSIYVDKNSIVPALEALTSDKDSMDAIYSVAEQYGIKKRDADFAVSLLYNGSYSAFIMDNFGDTIDEALDAYSVSTTYNVDSENIYLGTNRANDDNYIEYSSNSVEITFNRYVGNNECLKLLEYPLTFSNK